MRGAAGPRAGGRGRLPGADSRPRPSQAHGETLVYVGIALVRGSPGFRMPAYREPAAQGEPIGYVIAGGYVPHFEATDDHAWLRVTLHGGERGWLRNDPEHVTVVLPDPTRLRVCIDPGHGGSDAGARAFGLEEKAINFDVAYARLRPLLLAENRFERVWFTRNGDYDVSLEYRWDLANAAFPALFVSVHMNANPDPDVRGTETFFKCGIEGTEPLNAQSRRAACLTHLALRDQISRWGRPDCPWTDRGVICRLVSEADRRSYYHVLQNTNAPAILVECLYLTNPGEARCAANPQFRERLARGIYRGIEDALFTAAPGDACAFRTLVGL